MRLYFILITIICITGCNGKTTDAQEDQASGHTGTLKIDTMAATGKSKKILLLEQLNYWVQQGGDPDHPIKDLKSTGEATSRFSAIKENLKKESIEVKWNGIKYIEKL